MTKEIEIVTDQFSGGLAVLDIHPVPVDQFAGTTLGGELGLGCGLVK